MRLIALFFVGLLFASPSLGQDVANVDPNFALADPVVERCQIVASDPDIADSVNGICITATRQFLTALNAPNSSSDESIKRLVIRLLELAQLVPECDPFDDEIAAAIQLASQSIVDDEFRVRVIAAGESLANCQVENLGSIDRRSVSPNT